MRRSVVLVCIATLLCVLAPPRAAAGQTWPGATSQELALTRPLIDPTADAEVLLWDVSIADVVATTPYRARDHYLRIKIYNERGRDAASRVDLPFGDDESIQNVRGRTTSPAGVVTQLNTTDVRQRTMVEASGARERVLTFVLPAVVPGSIIEYQWRELREGPVSRTLILPFQRSLPVYVARYNVKPLPGYQMRTHVFNPTSTPTKTEQSSGYASIQATRLPAMRPEPFMPRDRYLGTWMLIQYLDQDDQLTESAFWEKWVKQEAKAFSDRLKSNNEIVKAATEATAGANTPKEKVDALLGFVRRRVRNLDTAPGVTARRKEDDNARDTLKRGAGTDDEIVVLFTALARAAGLEAYLARLPDREVFVAAPRLKMPYFLPKLATAIRTGDGWALFDAANEYASAGRPRWQQEGTYALVLDGKTPEFLAVGVMPPDFSQARRSATLRLLPNGDLEGECTIVFTGHFATRNRGQVASAAQAEREKLATQRILGYLPDATIHDFRIDNLDDPEQPYTLRFSLRVPGFARRTGTRLDLVAAALPMEVTPQFTATTRTRPVVFPFAWSEDDVLTIQLPENFEIEGRAKPASASMKDGLATFTASLDVNERVLTYRRSLSVGRGAVVTPVEEYVAIRTFFDSVRSAGRSGVLLRRLDEGNAK